jgi:hypothetical protein
MEDGAKPRDLEDRTFRFAESVRAFVKQLPRTISNSEDVRQLVRASGSVAANWIEADEALSKKDFFPHFFLDCFEEWVIACEFLEFGSWGFFGIWKLGFGTSR